MTDTQRFSASTPFPAKLDGITIAIAFAILSFIAYATWATAISRGFYADGSYFYFSALNNPGNWRIMDDSKHIRLLVNVLNQIPLNLLLLAGSVDPTSLRIAFNAPLFFGNASLLALLALMCRRHKEYHLLACASASYVFFVLPSDIFALNQARLAQSLYWIPLYLAITPFPISLPKKLIGLVSIALCFRSHESIILVGPLLSGAALVSCIKFDIERIFKGLLILSGFALCAYGIYWQHTHPVGPQTDGFLNNFRYITLITLVRTNLLFTVLPIISLCAIAFLNRFSSSTRLNRSFPLFVFWLCVAVACSAFVSPNRINPSQEFSFRVLIPFGAALITMLAIAYQIWPDLRKNLPRPAIVLLLSASLAGHSIWQSASNLYWSKFVDKVSVYLANTKESVASFDDMSASLTDKERNRLLKYKWGWTWPAFSMSLSPSIQIKSIIAPEDHFEEFFIESDQITSWLHIPFEKVKTEYFDVSTILANCRPDEVSRRPVCKHPAN